jgi:hypothetical protein
MLDEHSRKVCETNRSFRSHQAVLSFLAEKVKQTAWILREKEDIMGSGEEALTYDGNTRIESALWDLRSAGALVDAYLVSSSEVLPVHSVVLCARSKFFRRLITDISASTTAPSWRRPSTIFVDASADALKSIVRFLYFGEADIPSNLLADFLAVAKKFELDGLASLTKVRFFELYVCKNVKL